MFRQKGVERVCYGVSLSVSANYELQNFQVYRIDISLSPGDEALSRPIPSSTCFQYNVYVSFNLSSRGSFIPRLDNGWGIKDTNDAYSCGIFKEYKYFGIV